MNIAKRTPKIVSRVATNLGWLLLILCAPTMAFKVTQIRVLGFAITSGFHVHEDITANALQPIRRNLSNGSAVGFSASATDSIATANAITDDTSWDVPLLHFDDEKFVDGSARLVKTRAEIKRLLLAGDYASAQFLLGQSLHSIQDFYAHSSWVEAGNVNPTPILGRATLIDSAGPGIPNCDATKLASPSPITSGYFDLTQIVPDTKTIWTNNQDNEPNWPPFKCRHGADLGLGLNKDQPGRGPLYTVAFNVAVAASAQYVNDVLTDVASSDSAVCGLMGLDHSTACQVVTLKVGDVVAGWSGLPSNIALSVLTATTQLAFELRGNNTCTGERGTPHFSNFVASKVPRDIPLTFLAAGTVVGMPSENGGPGVNRRNCSSFYASIPVPDPHDNSIVRSRTWINATGRGFSTNGINTLDWEYQIRYDSGDPFSGAGKSCVLGVVPNSDFFAASANLSQCTVETQ